MTLRTPAVVKPSSRAAGAHLPLAPPEMIAEFFILFSVSLPGYGSHPYLCFLSSHATYRCLSPLLFLTESLRIYLFVSTLFNPFSLRMVLSKAEEENTKKLNLSQNVYSPSQTGSSQDFQNYTGFPGTLSCAEHYRARKGWRDQVLGSYLLFLHLITDRMPECHEQ